MSHETTRTLTPRNHLGGSDSSKEDNLEEDTEGMFIANTGTFGLRLTNTSPPPDGNETGSDAESDRAEPGQARAV